jgi:hypothetical protein
MNKKISNLLILLLILCCLNIVNVKAAVDTGGGVSTTDGCQYGIQCLYETDKNNPNTVNANIDYLGTGTIFLAIGYQCSDHEIDAIRCKGDLSYTSYAHATIAKLGDDPNQLYYDDLGWGGDNQADYDKIFGDNTPNYKSNFIKGTTSYVCPSELYYRYNNNGALSVYYDASSFSSGFSTSQSGMLKLDSSSTSCINQGEWGDIKGLARHAAGTQVTGEAQAMADTATEALQPGTTNQNLVSSVLNWANWYKSSSSTTNTNDSDSPSCTTLLGGDQSDIVQFIQKVYKLMAAGAIIMLIFLVSIDFVKAIAASDDDGLKKAFEKSKKRLIGLIILFLLPALLDMIINFINNNTHYDGQEWVIGSVSDCQVTSK